MAGARHTAITNVFTGRPARGIVNRIVAELGPISGAAPPFPLAAHGSIQVFFGDETEPTLSANDRTLTSGRVGVGSFDETAEFRGWSAR